MERSGGREMHYYKGSAWVPAFAGTRASGRAEKEVGIVPSITNKNGN